MRTSATRWQFIIFFHPRRLRTVMNAEDRPCDRDRRELLICLAGLFKLLSRLISSDILHNVSAFDYILAARRWWFACSILITFYSWKYWILFTLWGVFRRNVTNVWVSADGGRNYWTGQGGKCKKFKLKEKHVKAIKRLKQGWKRNTCELMEKHVEDENNFET